MPNFSAKSEIIVEESLSYFTSPLKINPAISPELESVAKIGFSLDGFVDVAKWRVEATRLRLKNKTKRYFITI